MAKLSGKYLDPSSFKNEADIGNGVKVAYVLADAPASNKMLTVSTSGLINRLTAEYSLSGSTVTFVTAPALGARLIFSYIKG